MKNFFSPIFLLVAIMATFFSSFTANACNISTFTTNHSTINPGQSATLSWNQTGCINLTIQPAVGTFPATASGSVTVSPIVTTEYIISGGDNSGGTCIQTLRITVNSNPPFSVNLNSGTPPNKSISVCDTDAIVLAVEIKNNLTKNQRINNVYVSLKGTAKDSNFCLKNTKLFWPYGYRVGYVTVMPTYLYANVILKAGTTETAYVGVNLYNGGCIGKYFQMQIDSVSADSIEANGTESAIYTIKTPVTGNTMTIENCTHTQQNLVVGLSTATRPSGNICENSTYENVLTVDIINGPKEQVEVKTLLLSSNDTSCLYNIIMIANDSTKAVMGSIATKLPALFHVNRGIDKGDTSSYYFLINVKNCRGQVFYLKVGTVEAVGLSTNDPYVSNNVVYSNPMTIVNCSSGINKSKEKTFRIYPNPVADKLNIETSLNITEVKIIDSNGKTVFEGKDKEIEITNLTKGIYFLQIKSEDTILTKKFVKD